MAVPDSTPRILTKADSAALRRARLAADSIKAPTAPAHPPLNAAGRGPGRGAALRRAGAVTLADLLMRIPGVTAFRANWIPAPQFIAWNGDARRVRVFFDGIEIDPIDERYGRLLDLGVTPLWQLEEVSAERVAGELRVHLRSWRVDRTTPGTRTDVTSGSENTNFYRGYYGRRLHNGGVIQLAAQQYSTASLRTGGDGSSLQVFGRLGWAGKRWSVDATWNRAGVDRSPTIRFPLSRELAEKNAVPAFKGTLGTAYGRVAWGDPDAKAAPWVQLIASTQSMRDDSDSLPPDTTFVVTGPDSGTMLVDTATFATSRAQYVFAAGASRWGLDGSVTARLRVGHGRTDLSPSARLRYTRSFVTLAAYAESRGSDSTLRVDLSARVAPWRWLAVDGTFGTYTPSAASTGGPAFTASRLELSTVVRGISLTAGGLSRDQTLLAAPVVLDSGLVPVLSGETRGVVIGVRSPVYKDVSINVDAVRWDSQGAYRPQMEVHTSLTLDSGWPRKFPRGNFHVLAAAMYDHRTPMFFPDATGGVGQTTGPIDVLSARLEFRIMSGTVFIQFSNLVGKVYYTAPGYMMPRMLQYYGLRWEFWN